ncbi:MAG: alkaline phosphatase family protein, partial [Bdellovibrionaceae bacterium]|nr:alkaline phosphatase family protein [Pseudobdellovibrionaceae bacterium]
MKFLSLLFLLFYGFFSQAQLSFQNYFGKKPKLVLVVVVDQLRSDQLTKYLPRFIKPGGTRTGGYRFLMEEGAYFPYAEYEVLQSMTCVGHAIILSGAQAARAGIPMNDWIDAST